MIALNVPDFPGRHLPVVNISSEDWLALISDANPLVFMIPVIWLVFLLSLIVPLKRFGLVPRTGSGLAGVVGMPFLHEDFKHLMSNTVPLGLLLLLLYKTAAGALTVVLCIQLLGGLTLWLLGRRAIHIGASLLVFGLTGFHISNGLLQSTMWSVGIALVVAALYGSTFLTSMNPWRKGSSWDGHLFGFLSGVAVAVLFSRNEILKSFW